MITKIRSSYPIQNELTGFVSQIENWIMWQPSVNGAYYWEADNVRDVFSRGIENQLRIETTLGKVELKSGGNYSYTRTTNQNALQSVDKSRGKQLIYIPKNKAGYFALLSFKKYSFKYDLSYIGKRFTNSGNRETKYERILNPYWLSKFTLDRRVEIESVKLNLKFTVENLFNEDYQSILWRPMPGRFYSFAISMEYKK